MWGASLKEGNLGRNLNNWVDQQLSSAGESANKSLSKSIKNSLSATANKTAIAAKNLVSDIRCMLLGAFFVLCADICVTSVVFVAVAEIAGLALGILAALGTFIAIPVCIIGLCLIAGKIIS